MRVIDLLNSLYEETLPIDKNTNVKKKGILLLDIDDTLLKAKNIFIWRKLPTDKKEVRLTPDEYKQENVTAETKPLYDMREFRDAKKVRASIKAGIPYINNLKAMDDFINGGFVIGILTARGMEDIVYDAITEFLKYRDKNGILKPVEIPRSLMFAVNDDNRKYKGVTDFDKKAEVIRKVQAHFDYVYFMDDDLKNIKAIKGLKRTLPKETADKIRTITATPPKEKAVNEGTLLEMAMDMFADAKLLELMETDPKAAGHHYIDMVLKDNPAKYGGLSWKAAATKIASYGLSKSGSAAVRKGQVTQEFVDKLKKGLKQAQADEPEEEKAKRMSGESQKKEQEKSEADEVRKRTSSPYGKYEVIIDRLKKEKDKIQNVTLATVNKEIVGKETDGIGLSNTSSSSTTQLTAKEAGVEKYYDFLKKKVIPKFILEKPFDEHDKKYIERTVDGKPSKKEGAEIKLRLEKYVSYLNDVITDFVRITRKAGDDEDSKAAALDNDEEFQRKMKIAKETLGHKDADIQIEKIKKARNTRRSKGDANFNYGNEGISKSLTSYVDSLKNIEDALNAGDLGEYVKSNLKTIKQMLDDSSISAKKEGSKYRKPKDIDNKPIQESEEEDVVKKYENLGPKVKAIIEARKGNSYNYAGIERDDPEVGYLYSFANEGKGNENTAFKILVNIYLDFIDGLGTVAVSKNMGLLGDGSGYSKNKEVINKKDNLYYKMGPNRDDPSKLTPQEAKQVIIWKLDRMKSSEGTNKVETKEYIRKLDFSRLPKDSINQLVKASLNSLNDLEKSVNNAKSSIVKNMTDKELYKIVANRISNMSQSEKFQNRVFVSVNFPKKAFNTEEMRVLAQSTFNDDEDGSKFLETIRDPRFSKRR